MRAKYAQEFGEWIVRLDGHFIMGFRFERKARAVAMNINEAIAALSPSHQVTRLRKENEQLQAALMSLLTIIDDLDQYQKRPERGDYGVECACCMGELFDAEERVKIEAARALTAVTSTHDQPIEKTEGGAS